jgi:hypothetical protein
MRSNDNPQAERRASARLQIISYIVGELDTGDEVALMNVSEGGLMVLCSHHAAVGEVHEFRFQPDLHEAPMVFAARVIHVERLQEAERSRFECEIGLQFAPQTARHHEAIRRFLASVADGTVPTGRASDGTSAARLPFSPES